MELPQVLGGQGRPDGRGVPERRGAGSSTGSGSGTGTSGSSTGSGTGGSNGGCEGSQGLDGGTTYLLFTCTIPPSPPPADDGGCAGTPLAVQAFDISQCQPICGATVGIVDGDGAPIPAAQQVSGMPWGTAALCVPPSAAFTPTVTADGYGTSYYSELQGQFGRSLLQLGMAPVSTLQALSSFLGFQTTQGVLVAFLTRSGSCTDVDKAGWTLTLELPDGGGPWPDGGYQQVYFDQSGLPSPIPKATTTSGVSIFYNIDTSLSSFVSLRADKADAGGCAPINAALGFTGRTYLQPGSYSEQALFMP